jgi:hypothetical protein
MIQRFSHEWILEYVDKNDPINNEGPLPAYVSRIQPPLKEANGP